VKILFDHCTPAPLRRHLVGHIVDTANELGWNRLRNGNLLDRAEQGGYDLLITTDQNMRYQQNLSRRRLAVLLLLNNSWPRIQNHVDAIAEAVLQTLPGQLTIVPILNQQLS